MSRIIHVKTYDGKTPTSVNKENWKGPGTYITLYIPMEDCAFETLYISSAKEELKRQKEEYQAAILKIDRDLETLENLYPDE